jgi:hypothetical protein
MNKKSSTNQSNHRTISNNNNNIIITNNNSYSLSSPPEEEQNLTGVDSFLSGPFVSDSGKTPREVICSELETPADKKTNLISDETIPHDWDYIKIDLFDNSKPEDLALGKTKLKLALNIKKTGQTAWMSFNAQLNSPIRNMKRGLDDATWNGYHYMAVRECHSELKDIYPDVRASKFYEKGYANHKGKSTEYLSVIVALHEVVGCYVVNLHFDNQQWIWLLKGGKGYLTAQQRKQGVIATAGVKQAPKQRNIDARKIL